MQLCSSLSILCHCLSLGLEWKQTFSSPLATAEFSKFCWHIECSTLTASFLRIFNSSTGIPSSLLVLFVVMLPKAHLTSHSRMSDSRWVTTPLWLSKATLLHSSSVYSCYLSLISSASLRSLLLLSFILPILAWNVPLIYPVFLKRSLFFLIVFPILLFSSTSLHCSLKKVFLSLCYSLELCIQLGISFPFLLAFCFSSFLSYL